MTTQRVLVIEGEANEEMIARALEAVGCTLIGLSEGADALGLLFGLVGVPGHPVPPGSGTEAREQDPGVISPLPGASAAPPWPGEAVRGKG